MGAPASQSLEQRVKELEATVKLRTEQLIASTSHAYSFLDSLHMGFIMCDVTPEVVLTNASVKSFLPENGGAEWTLEAIDKLFESKVHLKQLVTESMATSHSMEFNEVNLGKRVLRLYIAPMINEVEGQDQPIGAVILVEDVTEQTMLDRSRNEFFFIASHELRTPLTAIRGNSSLIKQYYGAKTDPAVLEMTDDIHNSSVRLIELVNDFLDASALELGKMQVDLKSFALADVVEVVMRNLRGLSDTKGVALVVDPSVAQAPAVRGDTERIEQVVFNLVGNALKFTEKGSVTVSARTDGKFVHCTVTDTGPGMAEANQKLLFRKFQQAGDSLLTRDATRGTGLGLYISKMIVELCGGTVGLEWSEVDKGSAFGFSLPRAEGSGSRPEVTEDPRGHAIGRGWRSG